MEYQFELLNNIKPVNRKASFLDVALTKIENRENQPQRV